MLQQSGEGNDISAVTVLLENRLAEADVIHYSEQSDLPNDDVLTQAAGLNFEEDNLGEFMLKPSNSFAEILLSEANQLRTENGAHMHSATDLRVSRQAMGRSGLGMKLNQEIKFEKESECCATVMEFSPNDFDVTEEGINIDDGATTRYTAMATYRDGKEKIEMDGPKIDVALSKDFGSDLGK